MNDLEGQGNLKRTQFLLNLKVNGLKESLDQVFTFQVYTLSKFYGFWSLHSNEGGVCDFLYDKDISTYHNLSQKLMTS